MYGPTSSHTYCSSTGDGNSEKFGKIIKLARCMYYGAEEQRKCWIEKRMLHFCSSPRVRKDLQVQVYLSSTKSIKRNYGFCQFLLMTQPLQPKKGTTLWIANYTKAESKPWDTLNQPDQVADCQKESGLIWMKGGRTTIATQIILNICHD